MRAMRAAVKFLHLGMALFASTAAASEGDTPYGAAWRWDAIYKFDALHASRPAATTATGLFDFKLSADAERLFGWSGTQLRAELLADHGGKPSRHVGTLQGLSNLEVVETSVRLYSAAIEHTFANGTGALLGLYDLNSEFYATEASGLLIHPAFGIGSEFAQTGANGPSIFPNLSFGLRLKADLGAGFYAQFAALDAVPGDPAHPGRTSVRLSAREGALLVGETGWRQSRADTAAPDRWAVGLWNYSRAARRLDDAGTGRNAGAYALAQGVLREHAQGRTVGFVRAGSANPRVNPIGAAFDAGVLVDRPWGDAGPSALTAGIALARIGAEQRRLQAARAEPVATHETTVEVAARWKPTPALALQPLVQQV